MVLRMMVRPSWIVQFFVYTCNHHPTSHIAMVLITEKNPKCVIGLLSILAYLRVTQFISLSDYVILPRMKQVAVKK